MHDKEATFIIITMLKLSLVWHAGVIIIYYAMHDHAYSLDLDIGKNYM